MAIYHLEAKIVSRGTGRSACAAAAYMSCSQIKNEYDGIQHDYTRKQGLVWEQVFLPENAPTEWQNRAVLWNAVEEAEKTIDSRLAREFVVALPVELGEEDWKGIVTDFIKEHFVSDGMCADCAIHNTDGHNPHAHIMLTVRPLDENGKWQYKTEKEYLCIKDGEEKGFTASEYKSAQAEGWEKQYPYYADKKKKAYLPPSKAEGLERADKHPKSTKYGRQNPITARWNSEEQLVLWRSAWADTVNRALERNGIAARIDHRSNAERGIDEQPTVHEGVIARAMEAKGIKADRCELNRRIKADNRLLRSIKAEIAKLLQTAKDAIPAAVAEALEKIRMNMVVLQYRIVHIGKEKRDLIGYRKAVKPSAERYSNVVQQIKEKDGERKKLKAELDETPLYQISVRHTLTKRIAELTEDHEELRFEKGKLLNELQCDESSVPAIRKNLIFAENRLTKLNEGEQKYQAEFIASRGEFMELKNSLSESDAEAVHAARLEMRQEYDKRTAALIQQSFGKQYDYQILSDSRQYVSAALNERESERRSIKEILRQGEELAGQHNERKGSEQKNTKPYQVEW